VSGATVSALWRYPVKSMRGERCTDVRIGERGIAGDRRYALVDAATGKVASAKNPRLWPTLLSFGARYLETPGTNGTTARVEIASPDGTLHSSDDPAIHADLGATLGRPVRLASVAPPQPTLEEYWPDIDDLAHRDEVTEEAMPAATFFDCATVHLLTTNTLDALWTRYPAGNFDVDRFRPNVLLDADGGGEFAEDAWIGKTVRLGADVVLHITGPAPRCVMTTLAVGILPADVGVLRTAAAHHAAHVGVYAEVVHGGAVALGDPLVLAS
jgi:uncharacterized protein YcbX